VIRYISFIHQPKLYSLSQNND